MIDHGREPVRPLATKAARRAEAHIIVSSMSLDEVVKNHSAFHSFAELVNATKGHGYTPTLLTSTGRRSSVSDYRRAEMATRIADAYDAAMTVLGKPNRAFRGSR